MTWSSMISSDNKCRRRVNYLTLTLSWVHRCGEQKHEAHENHGCWCGNVLKWMWKALTCSVSVFVSLCVFTGRGNLKHLSIALILSFCSVLSADLLHFFQKLFRLLYTFIKLKYMKYIYIYENLLHQFRPLNCIILFVYDMHVSVR